MSSAHVPKFGNWDDKDIPYTRYFENALKYREKGFNPNDPQQNPEAFMNQHQIQQQNLRIKQNKSSQKANTDPARISAKIDSYTKKNKSSSSVSRQPNMVSQSSKALINTVSSLSADSNDTRPFPQRPAYVALSNEGKEKKKTGTSKLSSVPTAPKNRKPMRRTSSKAWCCLINKTWE
ncbi:uncharacterized protein LOC110018025 [Phalaenopsis equestris]|uniref:uncharacterized protein LOC110018025 n=1 Tax=Phalaenopsis equestris TaxID=78828 RepID=UPI0009E513C8|nr:uncharacterized protein LOC110018025 [Phalaenopsis equestris]